MERVGFLSPHPYATPSPPPPTHTRTWSRCCGVLALLPFVWCCAHASGSQLFPHEERGILAMACLVACQLRFRAEDHTILASSGVLDAVSQVLTASHVHKQLALAAQELNAGGVPAAEIESIIRVAREQALFSPWSLASVARVRAVGVVRAVMASCLELAPALMEVSPVGEQAIAQVIGVIKAALDRGGSPKSDGSLAPAGAHEDTSVEAAAASGAGASASASAGESAGAAAGGEGPAAAAAATPAAASANVEAVVIPKTMVVPLSVAGIGSAGSGKYSTGPVAPHVDLCKSGWSVGWRMYWPREDQWQAVAPGSVLAEGTQGSGKAALKEGGLLWLKGVQALDGQSTISNAFDCVGARTLPGR
jgi:hypothetical protein